MTTNVKVDAHCKEGIVVEIVRECKATGESYVIENDQIWQGYIYDDWVITIREKSK